MTAPGHAKNLRQAYVDSFSIDQKAAFWLEELKPYARHPFHQGLLGAKPALLVMDMQDFFLNEKSPMFLPAGRAILPKVNGLIRLFRDQDYPVIFTRHWDQRNEKNSEMIRWWGRPLSRDNPHTRICADMERGAKDILIEKHHYSAFYHTRLENLLKQMVITSVIITGVMTHLCCESTARDAFYRGFQTIIAIDGAATLNEELHLGALKSLSHGFATPALSREIAP